LHTDNPPYALDDMLEICKQNERNIAMETAADILYTSATFAKLAEEGSGLTNKPWEEIYELLKTEEPKIDAK
jgi:predicted house-cleaning noncanonical NTP pyrophosphatase (MazG superfamily)